MQPDPVRPGCRAQGVERTLDVEVVALREDSLRLLDHHARRERLLELRVLDSEVCDERAEALGVIGAPLAQLGTSASALSIAPASDGSIANCVVKPVISITRRMRWSSETNVSSPPPVRSERA